MESTQPTGLKEKLEGALRVMMISLSVLNLLAVSGSTVVFLVGYTLGTEVCRLNEQMIEEGYAGKIYDGGTKQKDFEELREIRRTHGTLTE